MSLRKRLLLIVITTTVALIGILHWSSSRIILDSISDLEETHVRDHTERALFGLSDYVHDLDTVLHDWAAWDDTYAFVQDANQDYPESNLVDQMFISNHLNLILFLDPDGEVVFGKAFDLDGQHEIPIPGALYDHLNPKDPLLAHTDAESAIRGLLILPSGPMLVASRPILTSEEQGPIRGTMIMGVYLDGATQQYLAETQHLALEFDLVESLPESLHVGNVNALLANEATIVTQTRDVDSIVGSALVRDIYGQPGLILSVTMDRDIYRQGRATLMYMALAVSITAVAFGFIVLWTMEHYIFSRLNRLGQNVNDIAVSGNASQRVRAEGRDELSRLARDVNVMLSSLEQYQRELTDSEQRFRMLFEQSPLAIEIFDMDGTLRQVNPAWEAMWQAKGSEVIGKHNPLHDDQVAEMGALPLFKRIFAGETVPLPDTEFDPSKSGFPGQKRWIRPHLYHLRNEEGEFQNVVLLHEDITVRQQAASAVRASEERFRQLAETIREVFWICTPDWSQILYISPAYETVWGRSCESLYEQPRSWTDALDADDRSVQEAFLAETIERIASRTPPSEVEFPEYRVVHPDGSVRWILARAFPVQDDHGRVYRVVGIAEEITERKKAEQRLLESELRYRTLFENAPVGIGLATLDGRVLVMNEAMQGMTGYSFAELEELHLGDTYRDPQDRDRLVQSLQRDGFVRDFEACLLHRDGTLYDASLTITPVILGEQQVLMTVAQDITEQKRAKAAERELMTRLERAKRIEALGTLAGGVAHDLNNILGPLVAYPDLIMLDLTSNDPVRQDVLQIKLAAERAAAIVQDLLSLARRGIYEMTPLNLNGVVSSYMDSPAFADLRARNPDIAIETELSTDLLNITGSAPHLSKMIMNLIVNAMEAMPHGGRLRIRTSNQSLDEPRFGYEHVDPGDYAVLHIQDTGIGIPPEDMSKIFEPFYTKKEMGRSGSGLGLAVVHGVIHDHQARLDLQSELNVGTEFTVYFPITHDVVIELNDESEVYRGSESVLVIDDLPDQRALASRLLVSLGYGVHTVANGRAAVEYLETHTADILILDMIMEEDFDGLETYKSIVARNPEQKAVIASGFSENTRVKEVQQLGAGPFIRKPYTLVSIGKAVRQELDR